MPVTINGTSGLVTATTFSGSSLTGIDTGKILQVKQTVKTDISSTTSSSFGALSGLSVNITPSATSSKILVTVDFKMGNGGAGAYIKIVRDSTDIYKGDAVSGKNSCLQQTYGGNDTGAVSYTHLTLPTIYSV